MDNAVTRYLKTRGIVDIPMAIAIHETIGVTLLAGAWYMCYKFQPYNTLARHYLPPTLVIDTKKLNKTVGFLSKVSVKVDPARLGVALAESTAIRKLAMPLTIPAKLWLTWKVVMTLRPKSEDN